MKHCLLQREKNKARFSCLVRVSDDWYPNVDEIYAHMSFSPKSKRLVISGDDDFVMIKENSSEEEFFRLKKLTLDQNSCSSLGFVQD